MKKFLFNSALMILFCSVNVSAQTNRPYTDGPLWQVQFVNTKPGMTELYLKNLSEGWIKEMRAAKDAGLIMDFKVLQAHNASGHDWNLMLMYELKNYAMLNGMRETMDAMSGKICDSEETRHTSQVSRHDLNKIHGGKM